MGSKPDFKQTQKEKLCQNLTALKKQPEMSFLGGFSPDQIFLVGGAVRDWLLDRKSKDFDFVVLSLSPQEIEKILSQYGDIKPVESRNFGVFKFKPSGTKKIIDVALPREDRWTGLGYKNLQPSLGVDLEKDLSRRDFTINAMALSLDGKLVDPFEGKKDICQKVIRAVGKPEERFLEDPSRILRGIRLACELGFNIEEKTFAAMKKLSQQITAKTKTGMPRVAEEVIATEFLKGFFADPERMIELLDASGVLPLILPEVEALKKVPQPEEFHSEGDVYTHTLLALKKLKLLEQKLADGKISFPVELDPVSIHTKLAVLFHDLGKPKTFKGPEETGDRIRFTGHDTESAKITEKLVKRLKLSIFPTSHRLHIDKEKLVFLVKHHMVCVAGDIEKMRLSTLEKYFFNPDGRGNELLALTWADISATVPPSGKPDFSLFNQMLKKLAEVKEVIEANQKERELPHLLSGEEIMEILGIKPSRLVGKIKQQLRDLQLSGKLKNKKEAKEYLKKHSKQITKE